MIDPTNVPVLTILTWPDDRLHEKSVDVTEFTPEVEQLGQSLLVTMKSKNGIGLAAPQCGILKNVIAIWIEQKLPMILVNPKIIHSSEDTFEFEEGCLSVPGFFEKRKRASTIIVKFQDVKGGDHEVEFRSLYAFAIQHEMDHLNGILFIDDFSELKKMRVKSKMKKVARKNATDDTIN